MYFFLCWIFFFSEDIKTISLRLDNYGTGYFVILFFLSKCRLSSPTEYVHSWKHFQNLKFLKIWQISFNIYKCNHCIQVPLLLPVVSSLVLSYLGMLASLLGRPYFLMFVSHRHLDRLSLVLLFS